MGRYVKVKMLHFVFFQLTDIFNQIELTLPLFDTNKTHTHTHVYIFIFVYSYKQGQEYGMQPSVLFNI